ncbi:tigger transposable element-derived protein 6-like [Montipora foliosa]|uniref:tigger transposable element-derived protein 6-like n=1 Tax=Montipora foliosa TaxID=591990 RepID=UPI0035F12ABD
MDFNILDEVLSKLNRKLARKQRNVILFLDNAPCHPPDMKGKYDHIKIVFFPANCTSRLQPLDLGIIQVFKPKYMKLMLTHVVSKIDDCNSATEVCKSVDLLQAIRWIAQAWESVSESTIKKCFAKAVEALEATSTLPTCKELSANWEEEFFSTLSASTSQNSEEDDSDDDIVKITAQPKEVKIKSMKEAMSMLEDVTEYLTDENLTDMANNFSRVLSKVQSTWLAQRLNTATLTKVTDFFK